MSDLTAENARLKAELDKFQGNEPAGLWDKYRVLRKYRHGSTLVEGAFVLLPEKDPAALVALKVYAAESDNPTLSADIDAWVERIEAAESIQPPG